MGKLSLFVLMCICAYVATATKVNSISDKPDEPKKGAMPENEIEQPPIKQVNVTGKRLAKYQQQHSQSNIFRIILLENKMAHLDANMAAVMKMMALQSKSPCSGKSNCKKWLKSLTEDLKRLKEQLEENKNGLAILRENVADQASNVSLSELILWKNISALSNALQKKDEKISSVAVQLANHAAKAKLEAASVLRNISALKDSLRKRDSMISTLEAKLLNVEAKVALSDGNMSVLYTKLGKTEDGISILEGKLVKQEAKASSVEFALKKSVKALDDKMRKEEIRVSSLEIKLSKQEKTVASVRQTFSAFDTKLGKTEDGISVLEGKLKKQEAKASSVESALKKNVTALDDKMRNNEGRISSLDSKFSKQEVTLASLRKDISALSLRLGQKDKKITEIEAKLGGHETMLATCPTKCPVTLTSYNYPSYGLTYDGSFRAKIGKPYKQFYIVYKPSSIVLLESVDRPNHYLGNGTDFIKLRSRSSVFGTGTREDGASFIIRRDMWYPGTVSFESAKRPGYFIRHSGYVLWLHSGSSTTYKKDASYMIN